MDVTKLLLPIPLDSSLCRMKGLDTRDTAEEVPGVGQHDLQVELRHSMAGGAMAWREAGASGWPSLGLWPSSHGLLWAEPSVSGDSAGHTPSGTDVRPGH